MISETFLTHPSLQRILNFTIDISATTMVTSCNIYKDAAFGPLLQESLKLLRHMWPQLILSWRTISP